MADTDVRFCLLGPVQVLVNDRAMAIGGPGMRGVLAMLLLEPNQVVPLDRMVDVLWAHEPPAGARTMVQGYVSRLRQRLGDVDPAGGVRIVTNPPGYRLVVDESLIDVTVARTLLADARGVPARRRAELLREAQTLWRGPALANLAGRVSAPELSELRLAVLEARFDADLELGLHHEVIGELTQLVGEHPFRERLVGQLMLALYRSGRRATALEAYQRFAHRAADELGMDPGPQLRALHARVLRDDTGLLSPSQEPVVSPRVGVVVPAQLPRSPSGFAGREEELGWLNRLLAADVPLGVLAGPAGVGKTALAVRWAHQVADRFPDGQLFASLRGFDPQHAPADPTDVLTQFLLALGVGIDDVPYQLDDRATLFRSILADRRVLVVLDDARDSEQIHPLLPAGSSSFVLVTSRVRLDGLVARTGARMLPVGTLATDAAERLIAHMAGAPEHARDREQRRRLARLCGHLPLALRIVAARLAGNPQLTVGDLVAELADERNRLGALDLDQADTSVRVALDVTYRSLRAELARTVCFLGLFPGTTLLPRAVAALCGLDTDEARRRLRALSTSFVVTETRRDVFGMHDLVRLHAFELAESELSEVDREAAAHRLRNYYLADADFRDAPDDRASRPGTKRNERGLELVQPYALSGAEGARSSDTVPVAIYLGSAVSARAVEHAVLDVLYASGFAIDEVKPPIVGSWFRLMRVRPDTPRNVDDVLARIERALTIQALDKPQAEIDSAQTDGVAKLISALAQDPNAFVQIGSVLLVKVDGVVVVRNLTQRELSFLQRNSGSLVSPRAILQALEGFAMDEENIAWRRATAAERMAVEQGSVRVVVRRPDDHGTVNIILYNEHGTVSSYDVTFGAPNGSAPVRVQSKNTAHVEAGPDDTALLHAGKPTLILKRPDGFPHEIEMTLDCGNGPTTYLLHFTADV